MQASISVSFSSGVSDELYFGGYCSLWNLPNIFQSDILISNQTTSSRKENFFHAVVLSFLHIADGLNIISIVDYRLLGSPCDSIWWSHHHQLYSPIPSAVTHSSVYLMRDRTKRKDRGFRWVRNSFQFPHHLENYICLTFSWVHIHSSWSVLQSILWLPSANCVDAVRIKYFYVWYWARVLQCTVLDGKRKVGVRAAVYL